MKKHLFITLFTIFCVTLYAEDNKNKEDLEYTKSIPHTKKAFIKELKCNKTENIINRLTWTEERHKNREKIHPILFSIANDTSLSWNIRDKSLNILLGKLSKKEIDMLIKLAGEFKSALRVIKPTDLERLTDKELFHVWTQMSLHSDSLALYDLSFEMKYHKTLNDKLLIFLKTNKILSQKEKNRIIENLTPKSSTISNNKSQKYNKKETK